MGRRWTVYVGAQYNVEAQAGKATLDGGLTAIDWLEPTHLSVVSDGEIGELRCVGEKHPEDALSLIPLHAPIQIYDNSTATEDSPGDIVFDGVITKRHYIFGAEQETFELIAYNLGDDILRRIAVHGQHRRSHSLEETTWDNAPVDGATGITSTDLIKIDSPAVFNPSGLGNATSQKYFINDGGVEGGNTIRLFDVPGRDQKTYPSGGGADDAFEIKSVAWHLSEAVAYLLNLYNVGWAIDTTSFGDVPIGVFTEKGDPVLNDVNVEGKNLNEALNILLTPYNYGYYVRTDIDNGGAKHRIYFYKRYDSQFTDTLNFSVRGTDASTSTANCIHLDLIDDGSQVFNTIYSYGDRIQVTTLAHTNPPDPDDDAPVMKLLKGWDSDDLTWPEEWDGNSPVTDPTFGDFVKNYCNRDLISPTIDGKPYGVGRIWYVNLGEVATESLEDLGVDLANAPFTNRNSIDNRRFEKPQIYDHNSAGGLLHEEEIQLEMSTDAGAHWSIIERHWYRILPDHLGIVFTPENLELLGIDLTNTDNPTGVGYWQALKADKLQIRILVSVKSDERVSAFHTNVGDTLPLACEKVFNNPAYHRSIINPATSDLVWWAKYEPVVSTTNDTSALSTLSGLWADQNDKLAHSGSAVVVLETFNRYHPGVQITELTNRSVTFAPAPCILRCIYDLANLHVHLVLDNRRVRSVLGARPEFDRNRELARLGLSSVGHLGSGSHHAQFRPGDLQGMTDAMREGRVP